MQLPNRSIDNLQSGRECETCIGEAGQPTEGQANTHFTDVDRSRAEIVKHTQR